MTAPRGPAPAADQVLAALPNPLLISDPRGTIRYVNPAAEELFSQGAAHLYRQSLESLLPFGSPLLSLVEQVRASGQSTVEHEIDIGTPRTGPRMVNAHVSFLPDGDDCVLISLQQTSLASKMDRQWLQRAAARSVTGMAAVLAHEVKNPLSGIRGAAQLLEQSAGGDDRLLTRLICEEADRIVGLVDRMAMASDKPFAVGPVNVHRVLERVRLIAENSGLGGVRIVEDYDPSLPPASGSFDQLVQVFLNLVNNAREALDGAGGTRGTGGAGGEIVLRTAYRHGVRLAVPGARVRLALPLEISVEDNGPGVPEEIAAQLFDPFVTSKPRGTGLGLAVVAKIIGDHGGIVDCDSRPRRTQFRVMLPMHPDAGDEGTES